MTQRKKMETPSKQPKISTMIHEEQQEMQHDISKLRDQVKQISLSQKVIDAKMDGSKNGMEAEMDGMDAKMDGIEGKIKGNMEDLKINLTKLLQEILTKGKRVVKETHYENKKNVIHDFIDFNIGLNTHHVPKINMRNSNRKDPVTWIL